MSSTDAENNLLLRRNQDDIDEKERNERMSGIVRVLSRTNQY